MDMNQFFLMEAVINGPRREAERQRTEALLCEAKRLLARGQALERELRAERQARENRGGKSES